jgi:hypothetical protein
MAQMTPTHPAAEPPASNRTSQPETPPPDWFVAAMPQGYQTRLAEIRRMTAELREMDRYGRLLIEFGAPLGDVIRATFAAMKYDVTDLAAGDNARCAVWLDKKRRLLVCPADGASPINRKSTEVARAFALLHEHAEPDDRVVLAANVNAMRPPAERGETVTPEALEFLERLGVNVVSGPLLFSLWTLSLQEPVRAQKAVERLHAQDGGLYTMSTTH